MYVTGGEDERESVRGERNLAHDLRDLTAIRRHHGRGTAVSTSSTAEKYVVTFGGKETLNDEVAGGPGVP